MGWIKIGASSDTPAWPISSAWLVAGRHAVLQSWQRTSAAGRLARRLEGNSMVVGVEEMANTLPYSLSDSGMVQYEERIDFAREVGYILQQLFAC